VISILLVVQVFLALAIIGLIMLQRGKGADAGAALGGGGGSSGSVFGAQGAANFLSRTTAILAAAFFINSLVLATLSARLQSDVTLTSGSVIEQSVESPASEIPAAEMPTPASDVPAADEAADEASAPSTAPASDVPAAEK